MAGDHCGNPSQHHCSWNPGDFDKDPGEFLSDQGELFYLWTKVSEQELQSQKHLFYL